MPAYMQRRARERAEQALECTRAASAGGPCSSAQPCPALAVSAPSTGPGQPAAMAEEATVARSREGTSLIPPLLPLNGQCVNPDLMVRA